LSSYFDVLDNFMSDVQSGALGGEKPSRCPFHCGERQARISIALPANSLFDICAEPSLTPSPARSITPAKVGNHGRM
jgi:hypothetical protein